MEGFLVKYYKILFTLLVAAIAILAFYVGMLKGREQGKSAVVLTCSDTVLKSLSIRKKNPEEEGSTTEQSGAFAGSKNGSKYYTPGCPGLERIKPENRIWFKSVEDATLQGYTPAAC